MALGLYTSARNTSAASSMLYVRQNAPTTPSLESGSACFFISLKTTACCRPLTGHSEESRQSLYLESTVSGSRISPATSRNTNSPSADVDGQYIRRDGS